MDINVLVLAASTPYGALLIVVIAVVLPALVDLVTKRITTGAVKSSILLLLSLVSGVALEWLNSVNTDTGFDLVAASTTAALTFVVSVASFFGLTQPLNIVGSNGAIQKALPGGLGGTDPDKEVLPDNVVVGRHAAVSPTGLTPEPPAESTE